MTKPIKVLLTGANGMLGRTLQVVLGVKFELMSTDLPEADITNFVQINSVIEQSQADVVIHCAAMTDVNRCESEVDLAYLINAIGSENVAKACARNNAKLIAISTDYVFDGANNTAYNEFDSATGGNNVYGKSKFAGEQLIKYQCANHIIARISWLYGPKGPSFVHTMLKLADGSRAELKVVNDQIGNPTSTLVVAQKLIELILRPEITGVVHLTCEGEASWYDFAQKIFEYAKVKQKVVPCQSCDFPTLAERPKNSRLDKMALRLHGLQPMPYWSDALEDFIKKEF